MVNDMPNQSEEAIKVSPANAAANQPAPNTHLCVDGAVMIDLAHPLVRKRLKEMGWESESDSESTMQENESLREWADRLAQAISKLTGVDIGEHSSANNPWEEALDAADNHTPPKEPEWLRLDECDVSCHESTALDPELLAWQRAAICIIRHGPVRVRVRLKGGGS